MNDNNFTAEVEKIQTVPLAYHEVCMERNRRILKTLCICWAITVISIVGGFIYMWLQYDYVSTVDATGVYCLTDSAGNIISSDIMPEDIPNILEAIENSKNQSETN